jgi:hypothetical protein
MSFFHVSQKTQSKVLLDKLEYFEKDIDENLSVNHTFSISDIKDKNINYESEKEDETESVISEEVKQEEPKKEEPKEEEPKEEEPKKEKPKKEEPKENKKETVNPIQQPKKLSGVMMKLT